MIRDRAATPSHWHSLLVLPENRSAIRAAERLAGGSTSLLLLHGPPGVGKSAILNAAVSEFLASPTAHAIRQLSANEFPRSTRSGEEAELADLAAADLLAFEDLHHLPPRDVPDLWQLLDDRLAHARPTILTANAGPSALTAFPRKLTNRLAGGLVVRLDAPSATSRRVLLAHFAEAKKVRLADEALDWMAGTADSVRALIGFIEKLRPVAKGCPQPLTLAQVQEWLLEPTGDRKPLLGRIVSRVAVAFGVKVKELLGASRLRSVMLPRQVAMALARDLTKLPLTEIGAHFGGRDHSTVLHAIRKIEEQARNDETLAGRLRELSAELG